MIEDGTVGTYNALGPAAPTTAKQALGDTNAGAGGKANLVWVDQDFLDEQGVQGWSELPIWLPATGDMAGFGTLANARDREGPRVPADRGDREGHAGVARDAPRRRAREGRRLGHARAKETLVLAKWAARAQALGAAR